MTIGMDLRVQRATCSGAGRFRHQPLRNLVLWPAAAPRRHTVRTGCNKYLQQQQAEQDSLQEPWPVISGTCAILATAALVCPAAAEAVEFQAPIARLQDRQVTVAAASQHHQQQQHADQLTQAPSLTSSAEPSPQSEQCSSAAQQYGPSSQQYSLAAQQYSPAAQQYSPVSDLAKVGQDRGPHWLLHVLFIVGLNILGLWGVLKLIGWAKDSDTPVTVIKLHMGLLVDDSKLQGRLHFLQQMMSVDHGMFVTMEETIQACCHPPRGAKMAYADIQVSQLGSKHQGYDLFKQYAMVEQRAAQIEESSHVVHGEKPDAPHHRSPLERLLGVAETQDAEESQSCVVVTIVILAKGGINVTEGALRDKATFRSSMQHLVSHLSTGQLLAVELLVTPNNEKDFLSEAMLMEDYPFMIDLKTGKPISKVSSAATLQQGGGEAAAGFAA